MPGLPAHEPLPALARFDVLGTKIDALTPATAVDCIAGWARIRRTGCVIFCTVSTLITARTHPSLRAALEDAELVTPDGMPLVWLGRRDGFAVERVYGPDFMLEFFSRTGAEFSHYFYGGAPGVAGEMVERLTNVFPPLRVAGFASPPLGLDPHAAYPTEIDAINRSGADVLWIGMGHPKQEIFMWRNRSEIQVPVVAAVGAAFDFHAGRKKEAPAWMKRMGLQWLHRLMDEPTRLWRRYLLGNTQFLYLLARERLSRRRTRC